MPTFSYKARDRAGKMVSGASDAGTPEALGENLRKLGYAVLSVNSKSEGAGGFSLLAKLNNVTATDISLFTRQLATLVEVGIPILTALESINEQAENEILKQAIIQVSSDIKGGVSLADAMVKQPRCFNQTYVSMIRAAEASGTLALALDRLAVLLDYEEHTRAKISAATRYPITVTTALGVAFVVLTMFVLPRYAMIYSRFGINLPLPTKIVLGIHYIIVHYWLFVFIAVGLAIFGIHRYIITEQGRWQWDTLKLRLPVFGSLLKKVSLSRFSRISGIMLKTGVPVLRVLEHVSGVVNNVVIAQSVRNIREGVNMGKDMATMMKKEKIFPAVAIQMVALGEETGKLDELLLKTSDFLDNQVDLMIQNMTSLLEPVLILVLGMGVLVMALSVFLPMWNLVSILKK